MPQRSKRPCGKPGCAALVSDTQYCRDHHHLKQERDLWRGTAASRGYDHEWRRIRVQALKRDKYLCQHCLIAGRVTVAVDVDHRIPITQDPTLRLEIDNLQSLCRSCHQMKTAKEALT